MLISLVAFAALAGCGTGAVFSDPFAPMKQQVCEGQMVLEKNGFFGPLKQEYREEFLFNPIDDTFLMFANGWESRPSEFYPERQGLLAGQYLGVLPIEDGLMVVYRDQRSGTSKRAFAIRPSNEQAPYYLVHAPIHVSAAELYLTQFNPEAECPRLNDSAPQ